MISLDTAFWGAAAPSHGTFTSIRHLYTLTGEVATPACHTSVGIDPTILSKRAFAPLCPQCQRTLMEVED